MNIFDNQLIKGIFLKEIKNRFLCMVRIDNEIYECYVPSSSRLENYINLKNKEVLLLSNKGNNTRTKYSVFAVRYRNKYILLNQNLANKLIEYELTQGLIDNLGLNSKLKKEFLIGGYKADFYEEQTRTIIENKTIIDISKEAVFPVVYSERAVEQLKKLDILLHEGYKVNYNFVSLSPFVQRIAINPYFNDFYKQFMNCMEKNMKVNAYSLCYDGQIVSSKKINIII